MGRGGQNRLGKKGEESPLLVIRVPAEMLACLKAEARAQGIAHSEFVRGILAGYIQRIGRKK